jgi:CheY-like chemotaxis protein
MAALAQRQVLVVDDDPAIRACMTMLLESAGYDVAEAEDGLEALLLISKSTPDVVVSDLNMPRMSGFDLLPEVHRRFPQIVTIAMSGAYRNANEVTP